MARTTKTSNNEAKKNERKFEYGNAVVIRGTIRKILLDSEKVNKYSIDVPSETPNGKVSHAFLNITEFSTEGAWEVGTNVHIEGHLSTGSYQKDGKTLYTTDIIVDKIEEIKD